ncbi:CC134-like protein [Mya arenaria]|uniref:CC134-like protein n=1 Tax=Mya arenaria TaxID=6604 RepID=A0ABY7DSP8_MYAAR|nr:CC134-like protein [Mya arenaria]
MLNSGCLGRGYPHTDLWLPWQEIPLCGTVVAMAGDTVMRNCGCLGRGYPHAELWLPRHGILSCETVVALAGDTLKQSCGCLGRGYSHAELWFTWQEIPSCVTVVALAGDTLRQSCGCLGRGYSHAELWLPWQETPSCVTEVAVAGDTLMRNCCCLGMRYPHAALCLPWQEIPSCVTVIALTGDTLMHYCGCLDRRYPHVELMLRTVWLLDLVCLVLLVTYGFAEGTVEVEDQTNPSSGDDETVTGKVDNKISEFQRYLGLFEQNRAIQVDAVKSIVKSNLKYENKYKLTKAMIEQIFQVIGEAKTNLTEWGFVPGDDWPQDKTVQEASSTVLENVAMFGDLVLRLPDITHSVYDKNKQWEFLIGWATWFCLESKVYTGPHGKLLNLMMKEKEKKEKADKIKQKSKETKAKRKGPRHSSQFFFLVSVVPNLGQTNGAVKPEEDQQRYAEVRDYVPREDPIERLVHDNHLCFLDLKHADDPEREITDEKKRDHGAAGLLAHLNLTLRTPAEAVQDKDNLQRDLNERQDDCDHGQDANAAAQFSAREDGDEDEDEIYRFDGGRISIKLHLTGPTSVCGAEVLLSEVLCCLRDGGDEQHTQVCGHDVHKPEPYQRLLLIDYKLDEEVMHYNLVVLEEEERLYEGEEEMHDVDEDEDLAVTRLQLRALEVRGNVQTVQRNAPKRKR